MTFNKNWIEVDGDNTYAIDWPLNENSVVVEVGAYQGRWAKQIMDKYNCTVVCFEPQEWCVTEYLYKLKLQYPKLVVIPCALGVESGRFAMGEFFTDACSFLHTGIREQGEGCMIDAVEVMNGTYPMIPFNSEGNIDLMMMNIEGYEYKLLSYMIANKVMTKIDRLVVQYHEFADPGSIIYAMLTDRFRADLNYGLLWSFYPTLEARAKRELK